LLGIKKLSTLPRLIEVKSIILEATLSCTLKKFIFSLSGTVENYLQNEQLLEASKKLRID